MQHDGPSQGNIYSVVLWHIFEAMPPVTMAHITALYIPQALVPMPRDASPSPEASCFGLANTNTHKPFNNLLALGCASLVLPFLYISACHVLSARIIPVSRYSRDSQLIRLPGRYRP